MTKTKSNSKKYIFHRILKTLGWILGIVVVLLTTLYIWGSLNIPRIEGELSYQNSSEYRFYQQPLTRLVTVKKDGNILYSFFFYHHIFAAWVDETRSYVLIVTSDTGTLNGAQGLYIYDGTRTKKVYQSSSIEFANGVKSSGRLYTPWIDINAKKNQMNNVFTISPDGRYLFGYESGYEGGRGFVIDLPNMEKVKSEINVSSGLLWSPSKECAINYGYNYGDEQYLQLVYYKDGNLAVKTFDKHFFVSEFGDVYWKGNCDGIVSVKSEYDINGNHINPRTAYYTFSISDELKTSDGSNISKLRKSAEVSQELQNVFFTISDPTREGVK